MIFIIIFSQLNKLKKAIEEGREETVIIKNYRRDGTPFWNRTHISPMRDERGVVTLIIGLQTEVSLFREMFSRLSTLLTLIFPLVMYSINLNLILIFLSNNFLLFHYC